MLGPILEMGKAIIDRFIPDPAQKAAAEMELLRFHEEGDIKRVLAQLEINAKEAQHPSLFVSGGRPFYLWIGGIGFAYAAIGQPVLSWVSLVKGWPVPPVVDNDLLWVVITGLLGISGLRTMEKHKGIASK